MAFEPLELGVADAAVLPEGAIVAYALVFGGCSTAEGARAVATAGAAIIVVMAMRIVRCCDCRATSGIPAKGRQIVEASMIRQPPLQRRAVSKERQQPSSGRLAGGKTRAWVGGEKSDACGEAQKRSRRLWCAYWERSFWGEGHAIKMARTAGRGAEGEKARSGRR